MTPSPRILCRLVLGAALAFTLGAAADEGERFDLIVGVEDARGRPVAELAPGDLEAGEGRAAVVDVRPLAGAGPPMPCGPWTCGRSRGSRTPRRSTSCRRTR